ncbi:hypothetical protein [Streptomyces sp. AN091965]|uniref:hypothetical protein n=1 Tax=Streptomyces sp. AN091965 TaxID=2927803 RepID=UPI001F6150C6|nr:hypothetical protein [Streptomyces sp. AN091965]MCI3933138.1 hypothetical protein [Streptomyces sp. AN091965]
MRLRHTLGAALGALALAVTIPTTSAHATTGFFYYKYGTPGNPNTAQVDGEDIPESHCYNVPEVEGTLLNAWAPENHTDLQIWVYPFAECSGLKTVIPPGNTPNNLILFRSYYVVTDG